MRTSIRSRPAYAVAYLILDHGEHVFAERSSMAAMSAGLKVSAGLGGSGLSRSLARSAVGGESLILTRFEAHVQDAWVAVAPRYPGDIELVGVRPDAGMLVQTGSVLAHDAGVGTSVKGGGLRSVVMHEGVVFLHAKGHGDLLVCAYGGIETIEIGEGEVVVVDTGHLVALSDTMRMRIGPLGSLSTAALTGEGIVAQIQGPGRVLIQTRAEQQLRSWLLPDRAQNTNRT